MLSAIIWSIKRKFPEVKNISTDDLQIKLERSKATDVQVLLIDSRMKDEFDVSHLYQAKLLDFKSESTQIKEFLDTNVASSGKSKIEIVCYCSLGYRSSVLAQKIRTILDGDSNQESVEVYNLEGSIFKWANEDKLLKNEKEESIDYVHPFNTFWGLLGLNLSKWNWDGGSKEQ
eukprot:GFUD01002386.1.p1 GENE.GFUD01002386.1~~GFUD01002386.1.p1  ORF type:complete len:174 (+),score=28.29 GFUD01002386.1:40-561(+)